MCRYFLLANDLLDPWDIKIHLLQSRCISLDEKVLNHSHYSEISMGVLVTFLIVQDEAAPNRKCISSTTAANGSMPSKVVNNANAIEPFLLNYSYQVPRKILYLGYFQCQWIDVVNKKHLDCNCYPACEWLLYPKEKLLYWQYLQCQ